MQTPIHFDLMLPIGGLPGVVWTAVDVLRELNALAGVRTPHAQNPVVGWRVLNEKGRTHPQHALTCQNVQERSRNRQATQRVLLVAPLELESTHALHRLVQQNAEAQALIRQAHGAGTLVGSLGTGVWLLAQAGVLTQAPVPWLYQSSFAKYYPAVGIETLEPLTTEPGVICAASPPLLHMLLLHLIRHVGLAELAHAVAEKLLYNPDRQTLSAVMTSDRVMGLSRDVPLYRAKSWMQANASHPFHLRDVAAAVAVSERTLSRLFQQHLGQTPMQYVQQVRLRLAHMWLEGTWRSVDEIAHDCGYTDTSAFCRMFKRAEGLSPQNYRDRYNFRGPRALWKADWPEPHQAHPTKERG